MTDQELRKLNREDLLELLIAQTKENERLTRQLEEVQQQLDSRKIALQEAGSIAQAAMQLSGVFTDAEDAAQRYLENLENIGLQKKEEAEKREEQSLRFCRMMEDSTLRWCRETEEATRQRCQQMMEEWQAAEEEPDEAPPEADCRQSVPETGDTPEEETGRPDEYVLQDEGSPL